jgi:hypothetical protein
MWRRVSSMLPAGHAREKHAGSQSKHSAHALTASVMNRELLQLLALFLADRQIIKSFEKGMTVRSSREDPLVDLVEFNLEPMVTGLLIETAVKNRWLIDAWLEQREEYAQPDTNGKKRFASGFWEVGVGKLSVNGGKWERLPLRECCNKIIHAERIDPEFKGVPPTLTGMIETTGKRNDVPWRAQIDIRNYVRASLFNTYGGIDFPRGWMQHS